MQNQIPKQNIEERFAQYLIEGKNWIGEKKEEWAKIKYTLPQFSDHMLRYI